MNCELCVREDMAEYEIAYANKTLTGVEIAKRLGIADDKFREHYNNHVVRAVSTELIESAPMIKKVIENRVDEIDGLIDLVKNKVESFDDSITSDSDPAQVRAYTGLVTEMRKLIESLDKLKNDSKIGGIKAKNVTLQFTQVIEQVMQDSCQSCKQKLSKTLIPIIKKV